MSRRQRNRLKAGLAPGTPVYTGEHPPTPIAIHTFNYDLEQLRERDGVEAASCAQDRGLGKVSWVNVDGVHNADLVSRVCAAFELHPLVVEDILNPSNRPKSEDYGQYLYLVLRMIRVTSDEMLHTEQVSLVLGPDFVLTFLEDPGDLFDSVRERIRSHGGRIRRMGADYLAYALMDAVVDEYFRVLDFFTDRLLQLEEAVGQREEGDMAGRIHRLRRQIQQVARDISPLRDSVGSLYRSGDELVRAETQPFMGDLHDHLVRVTSSLDADLEATAWALDLHLALSSHRLNLAMRFLTIFSAVFMPLTFIAGIYGMNFEHMPELKWQNGYFLTLGVMGAVAGLTFLWFRARRL